MLGKSEEVTPPAAVFMLNQLREDLRNENEKKEHDGPKCKCFIVSLSPTSRHLDSPSIILTFHRQLP
jgi:hypothetical protein